MVRVMFCKHCGNEMPDESIFCSKCGKGVSEKPKETTPVKEKPVVETPPKPIKKTVKTPEKKGSGGKVVGVLLVGLIVFIGAGVIYKVPYTYQ
ncbi:MAG: zinc-ribbon domain-containing protein, partial [Candidatus Hydrothermarchaeaceae archaeon]